MTRFGGTRSSWEVLTGPGMQLAAHRHLPWALSSCPSIVHFLSQGIHMLLHILASEDVRLAPFLQRRHLVKFRTVVLFGPAFRGDVCKVVDYGREQILLVFCTPLYLEGGLEVGKSKPKKDRHGGGKSNFPNI